MSLNDTRVIVRVAGLPADMEGLNLPSSRPAHDQLEVLRSTRQQASLRRAEAVDLLAAEVPGLSPEDRRLAIALKRDCFNGRPLRLDLNERVVSALGAKLRRNLEELDSLDRRLAEQSSELERLHAEERARDRRLLLKLAEDREVLRGLSLASLGLVEGLQRLAGPAANAAGRKERKAEASLLRYLSRAALKLSPYSTLTVLALARISASAAAPLEFHPGARGSRSLVRVKRYLMEQSRDQIFLHPGVRRHLPLAVNPSLEELGEGSYRLLKWVQLGTNAEGQLEYGVPSQVKVKLSGPLAPFVLDRLSRPPVTYAALAEDLLERFAGREGFGEVQAGAMIEQLLRLGLICLQTPWSGFDPLLEQNLLAFLHRLPEDSCPPELLRGLEDLVWCEETFSASADPAAAVRRIDSLATSLYELARFDRNAGTELKLEKKANRNYYEDVFKSSDRSGGEILTVAASSLAPACEAGELVWNLGSAFEPRAEFMALAEHLWPELWPQQSDVRLLEFFARLKGDFEDYLNHLSTGGWSLFDPRGLDRVAEIAAARRRVRDGLAALAEFDGETEHFSLDGLRRLNAEMPGFLRPVVGPCLFLQPRDREATTWVAHRIFEGTGRMSSRFTAPMPEAIRKDFLERLIEGSLIDHEGERYELLDLLFTSGNTVNAHLPQTRKVLVSPGETAHLEASRRIDLRDLIVRRRADGTLRLMHQSGGDPFLPCFLSPLQTQLMPSILKFIDLFGSTVRSRIQLSDRVVDRGSCRYVPRQQAGTLVVKRRRWIVDKNSIPGAGSSEVEAFAAIDEWRRSLGIPDQIYLIEVVNETLVTIPIWKPQYIDFRSPTYVALFNASVRLGADQVSFDEALPRPEDFPLDADGRPRGIELMAEHVAIRSKPPAFAERPAGERRQVRSVAEALAWYHFVPASGEEGSHWYRSFRESGAEELIFLFDSAIGLMRRNRLTEGKKVFTEAEESLASRAASFAPSHRLVLAEAFHGAKGYVLYLEGDLENARRQLEKAEAAVAAAIEAAPFLLNFTHKCRQLCLNKARVARNGRDWPEMRRLISLSRAMLTGDAPLCATSRGNLYTADVLAWLRQVEPDDAVDQQALAILLDQERSLAGFDRLALEVAMIPNVAIAAF